MAVKGKAKTATKPKAKTAAKAKCTTRTGKTGCKKASYQAIQERAYLIWEQQGRPDGQDFNIWLQAEKELCK